MECLTWAVADNGVYLLGTDLQVHDVKPYLIFCNISLKILFLNCVCAGVCMWVSVVMYTCVGMPVATGRGIQEFQAVMTKLMWGLAIQLWSSSRATCPVNY